VVSRWGLLMRCAETYGAVFWKDGIVPGGRRYWFGCEC
jgi:hypothetical protein